MPMPELKLRRPRLRRKPRYNTVFYTIKIIETIIVIDFIQKIFKI